MKLKQKLKCHLMDVVIKKKKKMKTQVQLHNIRIKLVQKRFLADPGYNLLEYLREKHKIVNFNYLLIIVL
jgi:hypothetical protein